MQTITLSVGRTGTIFFAQQVLAPKLNAAVATLAVPNKTISVGDFYHAGVGYSDSYSDISIALTGGSLQNFSCAYSSVSQSNASGTVNGKQAQVGQYQLTLTAGAFSALYSSWKETYNDYSCIYGGPGPAACSSSGGSGNWSYNPGFGGLTVTVTTGFVFQNNAYTFDTISQSASTTGNTSANIPSDSILQSQDTAGCFSTHVDSATESSVSSIDFGGALAKVMPALIASIPASGKLSTQITYDWALGDSGMVYPSGTNAFGVSIGITGTVSFNGEAFGGTPPAPLPLPPVPADSDTTHHMQIYVASYEVDALYWAFTKADLLTVTATPGNIPDPNALKVKTYVGSCAALKPYAIYSMQAVVEPTVAPVVTFQSAWYFSQAVIADLATNTSLPTTVQTAIKTDLVGNVYTTQAALEADLKAYSIPSQYNTVIENAASLMGLVMVQNLSFTVTIEDGSSTPPDVIFSVTRTDLLSNLQLGLSPNTPAVQTMQFSFVEASSSVTFKSSTIPKLGENDLTNLWSTVGDAQYDDVLLLLGKTGTPIPIMQGFKFDFTNAVLSVQDGYVSILTDVKLDGAALAALGIA